MNYGYLRFMKEVDSLLKKQSFAIVGNEEFFKQEALHLLLTKLRKTSKIDEEHYNGAEKIKYNQVDEALCEYPLIGKYRLVVVTSADSIKDLKKLEYWFKEPTLDTRAILVFTDEVKQPPFEFDVCVVANAMGEESKEFDKYVDFCLEGTSTSVDAPTRDYLREVFANNIHLMKSELLKVASYVYPKNLITKSDLETTLSNYPVAKVFDLVDHLLRREAKESIVILEDLLDQGTDGTFLIHLITQRLQIISAAIKAQRRGENLKEYMIRKKIPLFQFGKVLDGLRSIKDFHISRYFDALCVYEDRLRSNQGDWNHQRLVCESMVLDICR